MGKKICTQIQAQCLPTAFRVSLSSMKFRTPHVINSYSANKITGPCKNKKYLKCKYLKMYKIHNRYSSPNSNFKLVQQISSIKSGLKLANITQQKYLTCHKP